MNGTGDAKPTTDLEEERAVEALLMAHRAGTPVAVAVTPSYRYTPFRARKDVLGLGWFWVLDAWTELATEAPLEGERPVVWRFRLEWCSGSQGEPWWASKKGPERVGTDLSARLADTSPSEVRKAGSPTATLRGAPAESRPADSDGQTFQCPECNCVSDIVYDGWEACLNQACPKMTLLEHSQSDGEPSRAQQEVAPVAQPRQHSGPLILPESLGMTFVRPTTQHPSADVMRLDAQRDLWRAWICTRCHMANERRDWFGLLCEWCSHITHPKRKIYTADALRPPSRPVCTGQRQEDGYATWTADTPRKSTLFPDEIKAVTWSLTSGLGGDAELVHVLSHDGEVQFIANSVLKGLQIQGPDEVRFRRHMLSAYSARVGELALCPFYTLLFGPDSVPFVPHFPTAPAVKWAEAPKVALDAMDLINERAGRVHAGEPECVPRTIFHFVLTADSTRSSSPPCPPSRPRCIQ